MAHEIKTGDCLSILPTLESGTVQTCVTSPPYFGLRNYNAPGQIGLEPTVGEYVARLVEVFRAVKRVLRDNGTLWLNLGDTYAASPVGSFNGGGSYFNGRDLSGIATSGGVNKAKASGLAPKNLLGIPWRVAFALQDDGWILRSEIIWHKTACMPESADDRPSRNHEHIFLLSLRPIYYYDADAIKEPKATSTIADARTNANGQRRSRGFVGQASNGGTNLGGRPQYARALELASEKGLTEEHIEAIRACGMTDAGKAQETQTGFGKNTERMKVLAAEAKEKLGGYYREFLTADTRNKKTVWTVGPQPFKEAHFATFPPNLIEPCILAGSREGDTVLDPFSGAGTTGVVAVKHGRKYLGCELNPEYVEMSERRLAVAEAMALRAKGVWAEMPRPSKPHIPTPLFGDAA